MLLSCFKMFAGKLFVGFLKVQERSDFQFILFTKRKSNSKKVNLTKNLNNFLFSKIDSCFWLKFLELNHAQFFVCGKT